MRDPIDPYTSSEMQAAYRELQKTALRFAEGRVILAKAKADHDHQMRFGPMYLIGDDEINSVLQNAEEALIKVDAELRVAGLKVDRAASNARLSHYELLQKQEGMVAMPKRYE